MFRLLDGRNEFYQWDLNRKIAIDDPTVTEIHFCNKTSDCSLVVAVYDGIADVPNILLQTDWPIHVYAYCGDCYTKTSATFKVNRRSRPDDYVYTETEVKRWEDLEERVNTTLDGVAAKEEERAAAEAERVKNEEARQAAEVNRVEAEETRNTLFTTKMEELVIDEQTIEEHEKRITQLEHHLSDDYFITDDTTTYRKNIAADACPYIQLNSIGGMTYKSSNLIPFPYTNGGANSSITIKGITYTVNADGTIVANGTADGKSAFCLVNVSPLPAEAVYDVSVSGCPAGGSASTYYLMCLNTGHKDVGSGVHIAGLKGSYCRFSIIVESGVTVTNLVFKPMVNLGTIALPFEKYYEGLRDTKVTAIKNYGANLIPYPYYDTTKTLAGLTYTDNGDGTITANGTASGFVSFSLARNLELVHGQTYSFKDVVSGATLPFSYKDASGTTQYAYREIVWDSSYTFVNLYIQIANTTVSNVLIKPMMVLGKTFPNEYKPYREPITYAIPEALQGTGKGIEGYADTIDFERGKYIKKCETVTLNGNEVWQQYDASTGTLFFYTLLAVKGANQTDLICDKFSNTSGKGGFVISANNILRFYGMATYPTVEEWKAYLIEQHNNGTPVTITYALLEPIETDLPESFENILEIEAGGSLEFINEHEHAVPSSLTYLQKEGSI